MLPRIIFLAAVTAAILTVVLLATVSHSGARTAPKSRQKPEVVLSLYIQQTQRPIRRHHHHQQQYTAFQRQVALVYHHTITDGPRNRSRIVGSAQGFVIPPEQFAHSAFNVLFLSLDTPEYAGSLSVEAKEVKNGGEEELKVLGGTGSFAFARGSAVARRTGRRSPDSEAMYHVKLKLTFPHKSSKPPT